MKRLSLLFCIIFLPSVFVSLSAQMPDWKFFRDREGNSYYYDRTYKIRIAETIDFDFVPVTAAGIDFFFHTGVELINEGRYPEGLFYLKSIRALKSENARVRSKQAEAAKWMNFLEKRHGTRYQLYDNESSVILTGSKEGYNIINSRLFYSMVTPHRPFIVNKGWKYHNKGYGLKIGARIDEKGEYQGYDYIIGVESRTLPGAAPPPDEAYKWLMLETGMDVLKRVEIFRAGDRVLYSIKYPEGVPFSGFECVYTNSKTIHLARGFFHDSVSGAVSESVRLALLNMVLVRQPL